MAKKCLVCLDGMSENYGTNCWEISGNTYRLARCIKCGSVYTDPLPDNEILQQVYENNFDYRWYQDHYDAKVRDCRLRIREYQKIMGVKVLDFGGGIGYFSAVARENGFDSVTYDPFLNKKAQSERSWDTVVALHVLEHSNNPDRLIEQMKYLLKPGGNLILAVPNVMSLGYKKLGMKWVWAQPPLLHIFHYSAEGLKRLLERHGFGVLRVSYHERWDANIYSDVNRAHVSNIIDALWSKHPFNAFSLYRRLIAAFNSSRRFKNLNKAMIGYNPDNEQYAELQIIASSREETP